MPIYNRGLNEHFFIVLPLWNAMPQHLYMTSPPHIHTDTVQPVGVHSIITEQHNYPF